MVCRKGVCSQIWQVREPCEGGSAGPPGGTLGTAHRAPLSLSVPRQAGKPIKLDLDSLVLAFSFFLIYHLSI